MGDIIIPLAIVVSLAMVLGLVARALRQPLLLGYIATGLLFVLFGLHERFSEFEPIITGMGKLGVMFLLFLVGIEISMGEMRTIGRVAVATGIGQILFTTIVGLGIAMALGFAPASALYLAIALTFSSTIIIVKLLTEKGDLQSLYGKIAVGFLIVQDIAAVVVLAVLAGMGTGGFSMGTLFLIGGKMIVIFFLVAGASAWVFPRILPFVARSEESLFTVSIAWCLLFSVFVASPVIGFSLEIGGFLAGLALARSSVHHQIAAHVRPLRDFFMILFFVYLGSGLRLENIAGVILPGLILSLFVLVGNPVIVMIIMGVMGYRKRTSFLTSLTVAQISEFSLIVVSMGVALGHVPREVLTVTMIVGMITMTVSTYAILEGSRLYELLKPYLGIFQRRNPHEAQSLVPMLSDHILLFGYNRTGRSILPALKGLGHPYLVVDFDPARISDLELHDEPCVFGDASDFEILKDLQVSRAKLIISTLSDVHDNEAILSFLGNPAKRKTAFVAIAVQEHDAQKLYAMGADYVIVPQFFGGDHLAHLIQNHDLTRDAFVHVATIHRHGMSRA